MIHMKFSQIWLQDKLESRILRTSFNIFGYVLEPCIEIWENFLKFGRLMATEKSKKAFDFSTFNFQYSFLAICSQRKNRLSKEATAPLLVILAKYLRAMYRNLAKFLQIWSNYGY